MERKVTIPEEMIKIEKGGAEPVHVVLEYPLLVLFYGKTECSSCAIEHLAEYMEGLERIKGSGKGDVALIFSPEPEEAADILYRLKKNNYILPVYLDTDGGFYSLNEAFPDDIRFHSFLLGADGRPIYVGNPLTGEDSMAIFEDVVSNKKEKSNI